MADCAQLCRQFSVRLGAHPGSWEQNNQGRAPIHLTPKEFHLLLVQQVGALDQIRRAERVPLHHIKMHGALYHATEADPALARVLIEAVQRWWPGAILYCRAGGAVAQRARRSGIRVWEEVFADRAYEPDGTLVPRGDASALISSVHGVTERVRGFVQGGTIASRSGSQVRLSGQTICVHSDTPNALSIAGALARLLGCPMKKLPHSSRR
jgi:UPF0271 protein